MHDDILIFYLQIIHIIIILEGVKIFKKYTNKNEIRISG